MARVFKRLADQVQSRRKPHTAARTGYKTLINHLLAWSLEVDLYLKDGMHNPPTQREEDLLNASFNLKEAAKTWLE